jgi:hypothetical protein
MRGMRRPLAVGGSVWKFIYRVVITSLEASGDETKLELDLG